MKPDSICSLTYILYLILFKFSTLSAQKEISQLKCDLLTIPVRENQLFDTCSLGEEFRIAVKIYMQECINAKHILSIVSNNGKRLVLIRTHNRRQKIIIESSLSRVTLKAVSRRVNLKNWDNYVEIIQKRNRKGRVLIILKN